MAEPMGDAYDEALRKIADLEEEVADLKGALQDALSCLDEIFRYDNYTAARLLVADGRRFGVEVSPR